MITVYLKFMRLDKPIGIFLLLWPTLMALWIAGQGEPNPWIFTIFVLGVIVMRSAGCVMNDIVDRQFDSRVKRTQHRALVEGQITLRGAFWLLIGLLTLAFLLVLPLNRRTIGLSTIGILLAALYPFMKRYTHFPQVILGDHNSLHSFFFPFVFLLLRPSQAGKHCQRQRQGYEFHVNCLLHVNIF